MKGNHIDFIQNMNLSSKILYSISTLFFSIYYLSIIPLAFEIQYSMVCYKFLYAWNLRVFDTEYWWKSFFFPLFRNADNWLFLFFECRRQIYFNSLNAADRIFHFFECSLQIFLNLWMQFADFLNSLNAVKISFIFCLQYATNWTYKRMSCMHAYFDFLIETTWFIKKDSFN